MCIKFLALFDFLRTSVIIRNVYPIYLGRAEFHLHISQINPYKDEFVSGDYTPTSIAQEDGSEKDKETAIGTDDVRKDERQWDVEGFTAISSKGRKIQRPIRFHT